MEQVAGFDWDAGNREKCGKHGLTIAMIESVFGRALAVHPDPDHSGAETRFKGIGRTDRGRSVLVAFTIRERDGKRYIRPISARYMHRREVEHYEAEIARPDER